MNGAALIEQATFVTERAWEYASSTTSVFNKARSLVAGDAQFFSVAPKVDDLRRSLNSESLHDKRDAMKRIVAQMCKGSDMRHFFPDVVKNIHVPSIELRKLIYLFIVYYAEDCPNETLLSISAFQKDLMDPSMHVRALALRMLAALRIPAIQPVVMVAVKKCAGDLAPVVRKTAALALVQMHHVAHQEMDREGMRQLLRSLLSDRDPDVVGAAATAFTTVCPGEWALVHPVFRRLCAAMKDCEEWGQVELLRLMLRYARLHFVDPTGPYAQRGKAERSGSSASEDGNSSSDASGESSGDDTTSSSSEDSFARQTKANADKATADSANQDAGLDADLLLLLNAARPLLHSMNSAVVVATIALYTHCGTRRFHEACARPAMRLLNTCAEGQIAILNVIYSLLLLYNDIFRPYIKSFFLLPLDSADVRSVKLRILARLVTPATSLEVFREFHAYVHQWNDTAVVEAIQGLALVVQHHPPFASHTIRLITPLLSNTTSSPAVVAEAVAVLRVLVLQGTDPLRISCLVCRLTLDIMEERITDPSAVATVLWLAGENISKHASMAAAAPDCFRIFAKRFGGLTAEVKQQVLTLGCKVWVHLQGSGELAERFKRIFFYVAELAKYDDDYVIRDEERLVEATFTRQSDTFTAVRAALLREKPLPDASDPYAERAGFELGTFSQLLGTSVRAYQPLPPWSTTPSSPRLRRPAEEVNAAAAAVTMFESSESGESPSASSSESESTSYTVSDSEEETEDRRSGSKSRSGSSASRSGSETRSDSDDSLSAAASSSASSSSSHPLAPAVAGHDHDSLKNRSHSKAVTPGNAVPPKLTINVTMHSAATLAARTPASEVSSPKETETSKPQPDVSMTAAGESDKAEVERHPGKKDQDVAAGAKDEQDGR